ncbi:hypothetical protein ACL02U_01185 [Streptomyces sp. MS06]|uniref:hypothetical protein n=1 Tax=Streptomyces sp. MS06 TaxID=3385974 RepID=UPI0039A03553
METTEAARPDDANGLPTGEAAGRSAAGPTDDEGNAVPSPTETLLRMALRARAEEVGVHDLRPAAPPARTVRRTRHLYTVALPLVGLAAASVLGYVALDRTEVTGGRTVQPATTVSQVPSPTRSGPTATASPTSSPSSSASSPSSSPPATPSSSARPPAVPDTPTATAEGARATPGRYVPGTWLTASEVPLGDEFGWRAHEAKPVSVPNVFQWLWVCGGPHDVNDVLHDATIEVREFDATAGSSRDSQAYAFQDTFYFKDADAAQHALDLIREDYLGCADAMNARHTKDLDTGTDVTWRITRTAAGPDGFAYRSVAREAGGAPASENNLPSDAQEWFVRSGNVVTMLGIDGRGSGVDDASEAASTLATLTSRLGNYPR